MSDGNNYSTNNVAHARNMLAKFLGNELIGTQKDKEQTKPSSPENQNELFKLYISKNYDKLSSLNLKEPVNDRGDTIIHIMAKNMNRDAFDAIRKINRHAFRYDVINYPNKNHQLPIHVAMEAVSLNPSGQDFISYMIEELGANPNIPDTNNNVIVRSNDREKTNSVYGNHDNVEILNTKIMENIKKLAQLANTNNTVMEKMQNIENINDITDNYRKKMSFQQGGFNGKRLIKNTYSNNFDEFNNSFVAKNKDQMLQKYNSQQREEQQTRVSHKNTPNTRNQMRLLGDNFKELECLRKEEEKLLLEEEKVRNMRLIGGDSSELRNKEKSLKEQRDKLIHKQNGVTNIDKEKSRHRSKGVAEFMETNEIQEEKQLFDQLGGKRKSNQKMSSEWQSDDFSLSSTSARKPKKTNKAFLNQNWSDTSSDEPVYSDESMSTQSRPRDPKVDEIYRSFVQKIMDLLGIDEETAKFYRSALKITIENKNPELKKRINDALKIKEMESLFENKKKLQSMIDKIDMENIKKYMSQRKEEGEKRKAEHQKMREGKKKPSKKSKVTTESSNKSDSELSDVTKTTEEKSKSKSKTKKSVQSRVVDNGYLQSDEILLSPN